MHNCYGRTHQNRGLNKGGDNNHPPVTLPVHSSLFYDAEPLTHGIVNNNFPFNANAKSFTTIFDYLSSKGLSNMIYSSWEEFRNTYSNIDTTDLLHMGKLCLGYYNPTPETEAI